MLSMKKRAFQLNKYGTPRDITIKNVVCETSGIVTDRGFLYFSALEEFKNKKVIMLIQDQ